MKELLKDIHHEPSELLKSLNFTLGDGRKHLLSAAEIVREARHLYITGIGSSYDAGLAVVSILNSAGRPAMLMDASEMLYFTALPPDSAIIVLSRSGKSVEIVKLLDKAREAKAKVIAITNTDDSPLARQADVVLKLAARFDHNISIVMYSALTLVGGVLASASVGLLDSGLEDSLATLLNQTKQCLSKWSSQIENNPWFQRAEATYFLARGGSLASCRETQLLWEEAAKSPASAVTTGSFRHGTQEMIGAHVRFGLWIDATKMRDQDLALAKDLRRAGARLMLIGQNLPANAAELVLELPATPPGWQFLVDIIPAQLAAEYEARLKGVDCDKFLFCPYIIEDEGGLSPERV